jgi:hypothetical protein
MPDLVIDGIAYDAYGDPVQPCTDDYDCRCRACQCAVCRYLDAFYVVPSGVHVSLWWHELCNTHEAEHESREAKRKESAS